jgi:hypothetical protein
MQVAIIATSVFAMGGKLKNAIHFGSERFSHAKVHKLGVARVCARVNELAITIIRDLGHRRKFDGRSYDGTRWSSVVLCAVIRLDPPKSSQRDTHCANALVTGMQECASIY